MLLHINPTRQRGKRTGSSSRASGRYMTFFAAGVITRSNNPLEDEFGMHDGTLAIEQAAAINAPVIRQRPIIW